MRKTTLILLILLTVSALAEPVVTPELAVSPLRASAPHGYRSPSTLTASPHGFVTFWRDPHHAGAVVMARFTPDGQLLDPDGVRIDVPGWTLQSADAVWNGSEYLVQAEATRNGNSKVERILLRMRSDGTFVGEPAIISRHGQYFVSNTGVLMVRGYDETNGEFVARADASGTIIESTVTPLGYLGGQIVTMAGHNDDVVVLVSSQQASHVVRMRFGAGVVSRTQIAARFVDGRIAVNGTDIAVAWIEYRPPAFAILGAYLVWFSRIDASGVVSPPVQLDKIDSSYGVFPSIVWNGSTFVIAWDATITRERSLVRVTTSADPANVRDLSRTPVWSSSPLLAAGTRTLLLTSEAEGEFGANTQLLARTFDDVSALGFASPAVPLIRNGVPYQYTALTAVNAAGGTLVLWGEWDGARHTKTRFFPRYGNAGAEVTLPLGGAAPDGLVAVNDGFVALLYRNDGGATRAIIQRFDRNGTALDSLEYPQLSNASDVSLAGGGDDALLAWHTRDGVYASRVPLRGATVPDAIHLWPAGTDVEIARGASGDFVTWAERAAQPVLFARIHMARVPRAGEGVAVFGNVWTGERLHEHRVAARGDEMLLVTKGAESGTCAEGRRISLADGKQIGGTTTIDCTDNNVFIPMWAHGSWWIFFGSRGKVPGYLLDFGPEARELVRRIPLESADMIAPVAVPAPNGFVLAFTREEPTALYARRAFLQRVLLDGRQRVVRH